MRQIVLLLCGALLFGMCARREHVRTVAVRGVPLGQHERMGNLTKVGACGDYLICANETESTLLTAVAADGTSCIGFGTEQEKIRLHPIAITNTHRQSVS